MSTSDSPWWRGAAIYQVYPRSFADGNGDGVGDLAGIRARLGHLRDLGVDAIWLSPWYPSPMADAGYDVADYRDIDPVFGTLAEAEALIAEAHAPGIRIIVDIVPEPLLRPSTRGSRRRWPPGRARRSGSCSGSGPAAGADGDEPPTDWRRRVRRHGLDPDHRPGRHAGRLVPAPVRPGAARPQLGPPARCGPSSRTSCGSGSTAGSTASGSTRPRCWSRTPALPEVAEDAPHPFHDLDERARDLPGLAAGRRRVPRRPRADRRGVDARRRAVRQLPAPGRAARRVQLRLPRLRLGRRRCCATCIDETLRRARAGRRAGHLGAVQPRRHPARHPLRPGGHHVQLRRPSRDGTPVDLELGTRRARAAALLSLALPGAAYVYQGEELGLWEVEDIPDELRQDPMWDRSGHATRAATAAGCRCRGPATSRRSASARPARPRRGCRSRPEWKDRTVQAQTGDPHSMLELYRAALRLRRARARPRRRPDDLAAVAAPGCSRSPAATGFACVVNLSGGAVALPAHETCPARQRPARR